MFVSILGDSISKMGGISIDDNNNAIRRAADNCHIGLAELAKPHLSLVDFAVQYRRYETLDGVHATAKGHQTIADEWIACLSKLLIRKEI